MKDRRASNKLKQKQLETKHLEEQTKMMEDKLTQLKRQIEEQKKMRTEMNLDSTVTRWQKTTKANSRPLKSYAKQVLEEQKQIHAQFGIDQKKIFGSKAFEGALKQIRAQKQQQQERNPTKITTFFRQPSREIEPPKAALENNFFKAKMDVKNLIKQKTLEDFLEENYILEYLSKFNQEGITDLEGLRYISKEKLGQMGVKAGHQVKIIKKVKQQFDKMLNGKKQEPQPEKPSIKVQFGYGEGNIDSYNHPQQFQQQQKPILSSQIDDDQNLQQQQQDVVMITVPTHTVELQVTNQQRWNCYQCYQNIVIPDLHYDEKYFCCEKCLQQFMAILRKECPACGRVFIKTEGFREEGMWFCSLGCCPNQDEIEQLFLQWHRDGH